ncbi:MAG: glutamine amidotransferase [Pseudomonadota bacterium]
MTEPARPRRIAVIRHLAFEDAGTFAAPLAAHGEVVTLDAGVDDLAAPLREADLAVVLGGPIGVYETARYPFLDATLAALRARLAAGRPTLGICLGAQLMAAALGARVYPGGTKELGWAPVELTPAGERSCLAALAGQPVLHWHGDTFDLPPGAERLAGTALYANQAFAVGTHALALQFHPEVDHRRIEQWLIGHTGELTAAGIDLDALRRDSLAYGPGLRAAGTRLCAQWLEGLGDA